jgi:hypothetical protein
LANQKDDDGIKLEEDGDHFLVQVMRGGVRKTKGRLVLVAPGQDGSGWTALLYFRERM